MRRSVLGAGFFMLASTLIASGARPIASGRQRIEASSLRPLLDLYDRKQYDTATTRISQLSSLSEADKDFDAAARRWIATGDRANSPHRRLVAATVALEIAHQLPAPRQSRESFILWACALLREEPQPPPSDAERFWHLSSVAALEELGAWQTLVGSAQVPRWVPHDARSAAASALAQAEEQRGHLFHSLERFPDEPRLGLVMVEWLERLTWRINRIAHEGSLFVDVPETLAGDEVTPAMIAAFESRARAGVPPDARTPDEAIVPDTQQSAVLALTLVKALDHVAAGYSELTGREPIRAEAELRLGYVHLRLGRWPLALEHLREAGRTATDRDLLYLSHYFTGWAHERSGHRDDAVAAYRQALSVIPNVRSATTLLAAQLFLGDSATEREEAYRLLDTLYKTPQPPDPFVAYRGNDARLWQTFMTRLRGAL
jgi:tetratricopeptide (TPR) repeat protein